MKDSYPCTNQRAELKAVLEGIKASDRDSHVTIRTDSVYAINSSTKWADNWERNNYRTSNGHPVENQDLIRTIRRELDGRNVSFEHVSGHRDSCGNNMAHNLAQQGSNSYY